MSEFANWLLGVLMLAVRRAIEAHYQALKWLLDQTVLYYYEVFNALSKWIVLTITSQLTALLATLQLTPPDWVQISGYYNAIDWIFPIDYFIAIVLLSITFTSLCWVARVGVKAVTG